TAVAIAANVVGVAVALGARHGYRAVRNEFTHFRAVAIEGHVAALGLGDFQEIAANAGQADGLRWSRAGIGCGHSFGGEIENAEENGHKNENAYELAHNGSVRRGSNGGKVNSRKAC